MVARGLKPIKRKKVGANPWRAHAWDTGKQFALVRALGVKVAASFAASARCTLTSREQKEGTVMKKIMPSDLEAAGLRHNHFDYRDADHATSQAAPDAKSANRSDGR